MLNGENKPNGYAKSTRCEVQDSARSQEGRRPRRASWRSSRSEIRSMDEARTSCVSGRAAKVWKVQMERDQRSHSNSVSYWLCGGSSMLWRSKVALVLTSLFLSDITQTKTHAQTVMKLLAGKPGDGSANQDRDPHPHTFHATNRRKESFRRARHGRAIATQFREWIASSTSSFEKRYIRLGME